MTYNSQGSGLGRTEYIGKLLADHDFVFIQEHWLYESQFNLYQSKLKDTCCHVISGMTGETISNGRPYGGCGIIWKNNISYNVHKVTTVSRRICAVQFDIDNTSILLCCVYMPTGLNNSANAEEYNQILNELASIYLSVDPNYCIIGGDFNVDFSRKCVCLGYIENSMKTYSFS